MTAETPRPMPNVAVVGGGLAGLAATVGLASAGCRVHLYEARRVLGGRASSFRDPASAELVDQCQHVGMGCCTNLIDFCRRTEMDSLFRRHRTLWFVAPDALIHRFAGVGWLPAPLHLAPGFWRLKFLPVADRLRVARAMWKLMRHPLDDAPDGPTAAGWLEQNGQSPLAIERFWRVILVSALGESLELASAKAARKVIVDGFLSACDAYVVDVPAVPLESLYGEKLVAWLARHDVQLNLATSVRRVVPGKPTRLELADDRQQEHDAVVVAVPWSKAADLVDTGDAPLLPDTDDWARFDPAPVTGVHLWFDRPIMDLPHAVLVGRLSQWIFNRSWPQPGDGAAGHYYQVVISGSHELGGRDRDAIAAEVRDELAAIWPEVITARLLRARVVTDPNAVFSPRPGRESQRPPQQTACDRLWLAGDWTATGWPATMEGAVRSGYRAAEGVLATFGCRRSLVVPDLRRGLLARLLVRESR